MLCSIFININGRNVFVMQYKDILHNESIVCIYVLNFRPIRFFHRHGPN